MPTIDELLNTSNEVATCTVNPDTREIIVPEKYKILGVFSDEKVTKIPFTCPKVVGNNVDLTEYNLYINYQNAIGRHNAYLVDDVAVSGDNITFSWLLSRDVTLSSGVVKYSICAKKLNGDSISNEWNTTIANGVVIQGLEATQAIVEENSDIIEAIISKAHTHANKSVLDKFAETDGKPTYDGKTLGGGSPNAVLYTAQALTDAQKKQARENVDAASSDFVINGTLNGDDALTVDKTYAQIKEAVQGGKRVTLKVNKYTIDISLPLIGENDTGYIFEASLTIFPTVSYLFFASVSASGNSWNTDQLIVADSSGNLVQISMDRDPEQPMEIATKQYVDASGVPSVTAADNGKFLRVVGGAWAAEDMPTGGTDMGITGAAVGQIAKITAVDASGTPTAWEPADMPSGGGGYWETVLDTVWEQDVINPTAYNSETGIFTCAEGELVNLELDTEYIFFQQCTKEGVAYNTIINDNIVKVTKLSDTTFSINVTPPATFVPTNVKFSKGACLVVTDIDAKKIRLTLDGQFKPTATLYDRPFCGMNVPFFGQNTGYAQIRNAYQAYQQVTAEVESPYRIVGEILCGFNAPSSNGNFHFKNNSFCCPLIPTEFSEGDSNFSSDGTKISKLYSTRTPWLFGSGYDIANDYLNIISGTKVKLERWVE